VPSPIEQRNSTPPISSLEGRTAGDADRPLTTAEPRLLLVEVAAGALWPPLDAYLAIALNQAIVE